MKSSTNTLEPKLFSMKNLTSSTVETITLGEISNYKRPEGLKNKKQHLDWCKNPKTEHSFYNLVEGEVSMLRISKENPPNQIHGLVADFDGTISDDILEESLTTFPSDGIPTHVSRSFSGGAHCIWIFEDPIAYYSKAHYEALGQHFVKEFRLKEALPGLDLRAIADPSKYYEAGKDWQKTGELLKKSVVQLFSVRALKEVKYSRAGDVNIPMAVVSEEARKRWPERVKKDFKIGDRTNRFWDPDADANSVIVTETGCYCFTGDKSFMTWTNIFGNAFVREFEADRVERQISGIYYNGRSYFVNASAGWIPQTKDDIKEFLSVKRRLSRTRKQALHSEIDEALTMIREQNFVSGTFPFLYDTNDLVGYKGRRYLNNSTVRLVQPTESNGNWAEGFPRIAEFLEKLFKETQLKYFLAWLAVFYKSAYRQSLRMGQSLFIAGPPESGKTFLTTKLLSDLMGGHQGASLLIAQGDKYNSKHFDSPLWTIDDAEAATDTRTREKYFQKVKQVTANEEIECRAMYQEGFTMPWMGRLMVTMNDDGFSLNMLPTMDHSIEDKVSLFKVFKADIHWPSLKESLTIELPHLAGYLVKYVVPVELIGTPRFQVKGFHHPELLDEAKTGRSTSELELLLDRWRRTYFHEPIYLEQHWAGSTGELYKLANGREKEIELCGIHCLRSLGWNLRTLASEVDWVKRAGRSWRILNPFWEERMRKTKPVYNSANEGPKQSEFLMEDDDRPF